MIMRADDLKKALCKAFCVAVDVRPVATGFAISSAFADHSGDPISFYLAETPDGFQAEDDGSYLANLIARDIQFDQGSRGHLLDAILSQSDAYWDRESLEIRSAPFEKAEVARRVIDFMSALIRVRDLELLTREIVRSTFREDAIAAMRQAYQDKAEFDEDAPVNREFSEFPADLVIRPRQGGRIGAVYFVNTDAKLNEALLLQMDVQARHADYLNVIAMIEEPDMKAVSRRKFQRAQNRSLLMPIFRGDEAAATSMIGRQLGLANAAH